MFNNTNLREELDKRKTQLSPNEVNAVLDQAFSVLYAAYCDDLRIQNNLELNGKDQAHFSWKELSLERIYSVKEIEKTCVAYRLRFLVLKTI